MEVLISDALSDSYTSLDDLLSINNVLKEYDKIKVKVENLNGKYIWCD